VKLFLEVEDPVGRTSRRAVRSGRISIGSAPECHLRIEGSGVQPEQALLEISPEHLLIYNLGALNLVRVEGRPVSSTVFEFDELLEIGGWRFRVSSPEQEDEQVQIRRRLLDELGSRINLREVEIENLAEPELWDLCGQIVDEMIEGMGVPDNRDELRQSVLSDALGLGPLQDLLTDDTVSEIMVNGPGKIFVERRGRLSLTDRKFASESHLVNTIQRMVWPVGRRVDESSPLVDARLPDGSRVHAALPPVAIGGPLLTVRKFVEMRYTLEDLEAFGSIDETRAALLRSAIGERLNLLISGGASTGKTTLLNALAVHIPDTERVVTVEDAAELRLPLQNLCSLETRPPNLEGRGEITIRELVRNALRMRPDRIIVGECRGPEALDMLQAMNSGNDGSLATLHANSPEDALLRLETMVLMGAVDLPSAVVRRQIVAGIDWVIHLVRLRDGQRRIQKIVRVDGCEREEFQLSTLFESDDPEAAKEEPAP